MPRPLKQEKSESIKLSLMGPVRRQEYEQKKAEKQKKSEIAKRLLCSVILSAEEHQAVVDLAMHLNVTKPEAIRLACLHRLGCCYNDNEEEK